MPITFPTPTSIGEQFSASGKTWQWNGFAWDSVANTSAIGATGAAGATGLQGIAGVVYSGVWSGATSYNAGDIVTFP